MRKPGNKQRQVWRTEAFRLAEQDMAENFEATILKSMSECDCIYFYAPSDLSFPKAIQDIFAFKAQKITTGEQEEWAVTQSVRKLIPRDGRLRAIEQFVTKQFMPPDQLFELVRQEQTKMLAYRLYHSMRLGLHSPSSTPPPSCDL